MHLACIIYNLWKSSVALIGRLKDHNYNIYIITRLLGRPQPQMYPPVALNQYTRVNRTHKHFFIYASRPHGKNLK